MQKINMNTNYRRLHEWFFITYDEQSSKHTSALHAHNTYEIFFVTDGVCSMIIDDRMVKVKKNSMVLVKPNSLHKNNGGTRHRRYALHFTDKYLDTYFSPEMSAMLTTHFDNNKIQLTPQAAHTVSELLGRIYNGDEFSPVHLMEIISTVTRPESVEMQPEGSDNVVDSIMEYINKSYAEIDTLDDIAEAICISKPYMCNVFKKETTITVSHYLNSVKVNRACEILRTTNNNITETALLCGYNSSMYFCKTFKSIIGITPNEYKKIYK